MTYRYKLDDLGITTETVPTTLAQSIPVSRNYDPLWKWWWHQCANIISSQIADLEGWGWVPHSHRFFKSQQEAISRAFHLEQRPSSVDDYAKEIMTWLAKANKSESRTYVCFITGAAGVGKTTFATELYRKVAGHFHRRAIVTDFHDNITKSIEEQFTKSSDDSDDDESLHSNSEEPSKKNHLKLLKKACACVDPVTHGGSNSAGGTRDESPAQRNLSEKQRCALTNLLCHSYIYIYIHLHLPPT
jgi:hypothetical protein